MTNGYYRHPTIHGDDIVFVSEDDLWKVGIDGGEAVRLTSGAARVSFPRLSPDGRRVAFTSQDEGHPEAWIMDAGGGRPRRITYLGAMSQTVGWRPANAGGLGVVVASDWKQPFAGYHHLHVVDPDGAGPGVEPPVAVGVGPARAVSWAPDGRGMVIGRNSLDPARWKRYRGGRVGTIWIDRSGDGEFVELVRLDGNLADPMWIGRRIYFLSDHEGTANIYSVTPTGRGLTRHTHHEDFYARFPHTDGRRIVYHAGADLFVLDPRTDESRPVEVRIPSSRPERARRFIAPGRYLEDVVLHPKGHAATVVARGHAFAMPLWEGAVEAFGTPSRVRYRLASWLPDGERFVTVTDENGFEQIAVFRSGADPAEPEKVVGRDIGRIIELAAAPGGSDRVALSTSRHELHLLNLGSGRSRRIFHSPFFWLQGTAWSPDGRWLAFAGFTGPRTCAIHLHDTRTRKTTTITRPDFQDVRPAFDPDGRFLYCISHRFFDPVSDSHFHDYGFPKGSRPVVIALRADIASPFDAAQRPPRPPGAPAGGEAEAKQDAGAAGDRGEEEGPSTLEVDLEGIEDRILSVPVPDGRYGRVVGASGRIVFTSFPVEGALGRHWSSGGDGPSGTLQAWDLGAEKLETVMDGVSDVQATPDGKVLGIHAGRRFRAVPAGFKEANGNKDRKPGRESGWVDLDRIRIEVIPGDEWMQMFEEAWRLQREYFWTPDMSEVDWDAVRERYRPLVDRVGARSEFSDLLWELQGELGTSHAYELGGDYRPTPKWFQGFLGADLRRNRAGSWLVERIPRGDSWDPAASSPLAAPGIGVRAGDRVVAVDGRQVGPGMTPYERLVDRAGRVVRLDVRRGRGRARTVAVTTLRSEEPLRYRDWVEANRARVHEATDGRVGYVHIPDMGARGFSEFHRYWRPEVEHLGLVVDVRFNRGGNVSGLLLQKLLRRRIGYMKDRWGSPRPYPADAPMGPMVALTNEYAGSDGDIFSHAFKLYGLGPLIGTRTWGGVVGIWGRGWLVDGTLTTQPESASWFVDVGWGVENYGTDPDIEVVITPQDHAAGRDPQLEKGIEVVVERIEATGAAVPVFEPGPSRRPPPLPPARR